MKKHCESCGEEYERAKGQVGKFCSRDCMSESFRGRKLTKDWKEKISKSKMGHGWPRGFRKRQSEAQKKRFEREEVWNKGLGCQEKRPRRAKERDYTKYIKWRNEVYERDNYTCQNCGKRGGEVNADHIKMWASHPGLRYEVSNGQTLCLACHKEKTGKENSRYWKNQFGHYKVMSKEDYEQALGELG